MDLNIVEQSLSAARLVRYRALVGGELPPAMHLYEWNMAISEAFYRPLQILEIVVRNAMGEALRAKFGPNWFLPDTIVFLQNVQVDQLAKARTELTRRRVPLEHGRMLAELNFGFWTALLSPKYENHLWRTILRPLFANGPTRLLRKDVHSPMDRLRLFRNRIAHHEPIYDRALSDDYNTILTLVRWLEPTTAQWCDDTNQVTAVLAARP